MSDSHLAARDRSRPGIGDVLFGRRGTTNRTTYALVGVIGFAIKHNLDRLLAWSCGERWTIFSYLDPLARLAGSGEPAASDLRFLQILLAASLPFVWVGLVLTARRLRAIGASPRLAVLFFLPVLNLVFFLTLCLVPGKEAEGSDVAVESGTAEDGWASRLPEGNAESVLLSGAVAGAFGAGATVFGVAYLRHYGAGLFVAIPFCIGMIAALLHGARVPRTIGSTSQAALLGTFIAGGLLVAFAVEGFLCLFMAAPLAIPLVLLGAWLGHATRDATRIVPGLLIFLPLLLGAESAVAPPPASLRTTTEVRIAAPPETVWKHVVAFTELPDPESGIFRLGIAYPKSARIEGIGPGAIRRCRFSTGDFVEPITVWDEPRRLAFDVAEQPVIMTEWSPYRNLAPAHLDHYFQSERGEFLLEATTDGGTRLTGTTWYRHRIAPSFYWRAWSDAIVHRIHRRVLEHVKRLAESDVAAGRGTTGDAPPGP